MGFHIDQLSLNCFILIYHLASKLIYGFSHRSIKPTIHLGLTLYTISKADLPVDLFMLELRENSAWGIVKSH